MKQLKKNIYKHANILIFLFFLLISFVSYRLNSTEFFKMNISNIITFYIATFFAFHLTQKNNKIQKKKEKAEALLLKYQRILNYDVFINIKTLADVDILFMLHRRLSNLQTLLKDLDLNISDEITLIKRDTDHHKLLLDNHMSDLDYLVKTDVEFNRLIDNIDYNIDKCIMKLFDI